jgi:hypothetical protein
MMEWIAILVWLWILWRIRATFQLFNSMREEQ